MKRIIFRVGLQGNKMPFRTFSASSLLLSKIISYKLADIGEGILEVEVLDVYIREGEHVKAFQRLCEVQSDKATVDVTSRYDGIIKKLYINKGEQAFVGKPLADMEVDDSVVTKEKPISQEPTPGAKPAKTSAAQDLPHAAPTSTAPVVSAAGKKIIPYRLADIGEGILEVEVLQIFVKEGDDVKAFDKICEVQSDKATVDVTSRYNGKIVKLYINENEKAFVGSAIADMEIDTNIVTKEKPIQSSEGAGGTAPQAQAIQHSGSPAVAASFTGGASGGKVLAVPSTRAYAKEHGVDLGKVIPTGADGRVTIGDVKKFLEGGASAVTPTGAAPPTSAGAMKGVFGDRVVPIHGVMKAMVKTMTQANSIPSFGACDDIEMNSLIEIRNMLKPVFKERSANKVSLSYLPFFMKAASLALLEFPEINAYTNPDCTEVIYKGSHNIGFAMDSRAGLIVPNIKNIQDKSLYEIAEDLGRIIAKGKDGSVSPADLKEGTFTLSNIGTIGGTYTKPVIFPPQVAIGGIGKMIKLPRFDAKGSIYASNIINISWSADHRVVDGAKMVRFGNRFRQYLEQPAMMLIDLR